MKNEKKTKKEKTKRKETEEKIGTKIKESSLLSPSSSSSLLICSQLLGFDVLSFGFAVLPFNRFSPVILSSLLSLVSHASLLSSILPLALTSSPFCCGQKVTAEE